MSDSQKDRKDISLKQKDEINFRTVFSTFLRNDHHVFVVQKTEKLASALYVVTGFISGEEPLRTRLRTCALDLVSASTDHQKARDTHAHEAFTSRCLEIGAILNLAERAGFISSMNARVLCDEYAELASFVKIHREKIFGAEAVETGPRHGFAAVHTKPRATPGEASPKDTRENSTIKRTNNYKRHLSRKDAILSLLDKKDKITIKDASNAIEGCSEKTIQRELITLVAEGVLLKEGERRWSVYRKA